MTVHLVFPINKATWSIFSTRNRSVLNYLGAGWYNSLKVGEIETNIIYSRMCSTKCAALWPQIKKSNALIFLRIGNYRHIRDEGDNFPRYFVFFFCLSIWKTLAFLIPQEQAGILSCFHFIVFPCLHFFFAQRLREGGGLLCSGLGTIELIVGRRAGGDLRRKQP